MSATSPDITAVFDDVFSVDSSPHVEISELEGGIWPDHPNIVNDYAHDCDSVGPNVVELDPNPTPPDIASEGDWYNHCRDHFVPYQTTYTFNILNNSGPDMMMVDFNAISIFIPAWLII